VCPHIEFRHTLELALGQCKCLQVSLISRFGAFANISETRTRWNECLHLVCSFMHSIFQPTYVHFGSLSMPGAILSFQRFASFLLLLRRGVYVFTITRQRFSSRPQGIARVLGSEPTSKQLANLCRVITTSSILAFIARPPNFSLGDCQRPCNGSWNSGQKSARFLVQDPFVASLMRSERNQPSWHWVPSPRLGSELGKR
jgi:hypothetical protein